ncbi:ABC transporter ATP-binding protein [Lewinella cohaerens]|uniref:ABC transporter ATP-binding protein n=1 Tax=Lewinella cohaerens TaxID=70995 RepID=UPI0003698CC8|nr:ABC transporter ATP-binding protein [Lewinella cohaerens]
MKDFTNQPLLLSVRNVNKKFTKDIRYNMYYGIRDMLLSNHRNYMQLREKEFWAIKDASFDLREGEILGVVGANGSGKTTLMRIISGIYNLNSGEILARPGQKTTSIFALKSGMEPLYTGRENIYLKGSLYGMSKEEIDNQMSFIEDFCELGDRLDRPFGNYSSGMAARLAYAIAVATRPDVFIIDEALAVGDSVFKAKCFDHLKDYVKDGGKGVLFVSNNVRKVLKIATRVIVMDEGEIIYNSQEIRKALQFYIENCLRTLTPEKKAAKLAAVTHYDF